MTTYAQETVVCGACRRVFQHQALASTNGLGSPDLDTRPPEMQRSTMRSWVQRCPSCGHCAGDASKFEERLRPTLEGAAYRAQLSDKSLPELAVTFILSGLLTEAADNEANAARAYLHAAWVLDDAGQVEPARQWRGRAADIFLALLNAQRPFVEQAGVSEAIVVDCLRRAGRGSEGLPLIDRALGQELDEVVRRVLEYQRRLIEAGDTQRHLISDAMPHP